MIVGGMIILISFKAEHVGLIVELVKIKSDIVLPCIPTDMPKFCVCWLGDRVNFYQINSPECNASPKFCTICSIYTKQILGGIILKQT